VYGNTKPCVSNNGFNNGLVIKAALGGKFSRTLQSLAPEANIADTGDDLDPVIPPGRRFRALVAWAMLFANAPNPWVFKVFTELTTVPSVPATDPATLRADDTKFDRLFCIFGDPC
jgi:hypothetical protein